MTHKQISKYVNITATARSRITAFVQVCLIALIASLCRQPVAMADNNALDITLEKSLLLSRDRVWTSWEQTNSTQNRLDSLLFTDALVEGIEYQFADWETWHNLALIVYIEDGIEVNQLQARLQAQERSQGVLSIDSPEFPLEKNVEEIQRAQADDGGTASSSNEEDLAKQSQNPVASLISVPFQNNTNFGVGEFDRTSNILNIQPVIPTPISDNWNLINRTIIPIAYQPELTSGSDDAFGLGDITYQGFFTPRTTGDFTWGVGPSFVIPTATDTVLGSEKWSLGPSAVGLVSKGPIVAGGLISQIWSFAGDDDRADVSLLTLQPFFNYNFEGGWYLSSSPIITANWQASGEKWTLPIGGGGGRVFNIGNQPVNASAQVFWNAVKPEGGADWTLRAQLNLLFPK